MFGLLAAQVQTQAMPGVVEEVILLSDDIIHPGSVVFDRFACLI